MIQSFIDSASISVSMAVAVSLLTALLLVFTKRWHGHRTMDFYAGIQKFHTVPTPRVGGIAIAFGVVAGYLLTDHAKKALLGRLSWRAFPHLYSACWKTLPSA